MVRLRKMGRRAFDFAPQRVAVGGGAIVLLALWRVLREKNGMKRGEFAAYIIALVAAAGAIGFTGYLGAYVARGY